MRINILCEWVDERTNFVTEKGKKEERTCELSIY